ncbi:MAG TPA: DUF389 domain-containing protein [Thermoleophilaceae bacterium]|nr:DUF389 domain-containing protein [Thermoleophilaceae bacterium]
MIHLRIVSEPDKTERALELLERSHSVCNVVYLEGAARRPKGDLILADVAREDASVILSDLKDLGVHHEGAITVEPIDTQISENAERAVEHAPGSPADAVVWEEVEARTSENVELSGVFLAFMVLAGLLAAVGIYQDSAVLIVGAMVVGPEFGPLAGFCVALVQRRGALAMRSFTALAVGFPLAILAVYAMTLVFKAVGVFDEEFSAENHSFSNIISSPDFFAFFIAACAGAAGMLSLSTAKSGALIGVLISVTTLLAAANVGLAAAYQDWDSMTGSIAQLGINLVSIVAAGTGVLAAQRALYLRRRRKHLDDPERAAAGLPTRRTPATTRSRPSS